jgi:acyl carrier protein
MAASQDSHNDMHADAVLEVLRRSCREALATGEVDADSDFFLLGGDSLAAVSIANTVATEFGDDPELENVVLRALFEEPTLGAVAAKIDERLRDRGRA